MKKENKKNIIEKSKVTSEQREENYQMNRQCKEDEQKRKMREKLYGGVYGTFLRECFENLSHNVKSFLISFQNKEYHISIL